MMKWLTWQEVCHRFAAYLHWTVSGYTAELIAVSETKHDDNDELDGSDEETDAQCEMLLLRYLITKELGYP